MPTKTDAEIAAPVDGYAEIPGSPAADVKIVLENHSPTIWLGLRYNPIGTPPPVSPRLQAHLIPPLKEN